MKPSENGEKEVQVTGEGYRGGGGVRQGKISWRKFRLSDGCRNFPCESFYATRARPLLKMGQVLFPKIWVCRNFPAENIPSRTLPPPPPARHKWRRAQKILLQRTTSKSHIGELAPLALCDIHVAGCGEHLPAWGLCDDCIPGTDQAVRGGRHWQKLHLDSPPGRGMPAAVRMPAVVRMPACHSRRFKSERPTGAATG